MSKNAPTNELLEAAISYAERGWRVFALADKSKSTRRGTHGFKDATRDISKITKWWTDMPDANVGIATGDGLLVIDIDVDEESGKDGSITIRRWETEHGEFPETASVNTGGGGTHLYFNVDTNMHISTNPQSGVDIRCDGGYVVAPPSIHPGTGQPYVWEFPPEEIGIARANKNVMEFVNFIQNGEGGTAKKRFKLPQTIKTGERNTLLTKYGCSMQAQSYDDDAITEAIIKENANRCDEPLGDGELSKLIESVLSYPKGYSDEVASTLEGNPALILDKNGTPKDMIENCKRILNIDTALVGRFYYDEFAYTRMITPPLPWDKNHNKTRKIKDSDYIGFTAYLEDSYKRIFTKNRATDAIILVSEQNARNPLLEWLEELEWDGTERMDLLLPTYLGADPTDYTVAVTRILLFGAVARAYKPGVKFDYMPILVGAQGIGKTLFTRLLAHCDEWHLSNLPTVDAKRAPELMRGKWIVEVQELLTKKEDVDNVKAFVTTQIDTYRVPYGRETDDRPRMSVLIGTTNDLQPLHDKTGNRRFLPVSCGVHTDFCALQSTESTNSRDVIAAHQDTFDQVWAEAVYKYKRENPSLVLDGRIEKFAQSIQKSFMEDDSREGMVEQYLDRKLEEEQLSLNYDRMNVRVCVSEIIDKVLTDDQKRTPRKTLEAEIHQIMQDMTKWESYCTKSGQKGKLSCDEYGRQRCYIPKE